MSASDQLREQGNQKLSLALAPGLPYSVAEVRVLNAITYYEKARDVGVSVEECSSAVKNIAICHKKLAEKCRDVQVKQQEYQLTLDYLVQAYNMARHGGRHIDWLETVYQSIKEICIAHAGLASTDQQRIQQLVNGIRYSKQNLNLDLQTCGFFLSHMEYVILTAQGLAIDNRDKLDFKTCMYIVQEVESTVNMAIDLAPKVCGIDSSEFSEYKRDFFKLLCCAQSMQCLKNAEEMLRVQMEDNEEVNFEGVWEIVDLLREGIILSRENDIETEARVLCQMGEVYFRVLKNADRARALLNRCVYLSTTLFPKIVTTQPWYQKASSILQDIQRHDREVGRDEDEEERQKILTELKPQLDEIKNKESQRGDYCVFIKWLYNTHPPKNPNHKNDPNKAVKNQVQFAIVHYHPDKQVGHPKHWQILCDEITKILNKKYTELKFD
eukprot:TRINITY_DN18041_c0_g2_i1.p1 TRINITY_DN18041_c0_g2~~TRINITY_DN18041_c0_g2_i1.p1  ORF type:complete len:440 (-),score=51.60 TRINITY_DN18041_c0_g2_i1:203-1522(-)